MTFVSAFVFGSVFVFVIVSVNVVLNVIYNIQSNSYNRAFYHNSSLQLNKFCAGVTFNRLIRIFRFQDFHHSIALF